MLRIGIDTGGTFTDFIYHKDGDIHIRKISSTPKNPANAVLTGLKKLGAHSNDIQIIHGTTIATNTLLERKGARTALITTGGFEDILEIGRQTRPQLYNLFIEKAPPLIPEKYRFGVEERTLQSGEILNKPDADCLKYIIEVIKKENIESIAICLLFSYANPANELALFEGLRDTGIPISVSHLILPEYREYERCSTTVVNAYVSPVMEKYISHMEGSITSGHLSIMQSNGGFISARRAREEPVRTVLSGPAAGVVGAIEVAGISGFKKLITLDMGGTSTDVSLCPDGPGITTEWNIDNVPIKVPMINIHTVGAGGGSIAGMDEGGALRVGPQSAGADPGPVCCGKGNSLTVTDANLYLGRLLPDHFLGGDILLDPARVDELMGQFASILGISPKRTAEGIIEVANANMEKAIRVVSIEKGHDPGDFTLVSFGGAGGLHACALAKNLSIPRILIPKNPGLLSAFGMLISDVVKDYSQSILIKADGLKMKDIDVLFKPLLERGMDDMYCEHISEESILVERLLDVRYIGQSYEICIPFSDSYIEDFNALHRKMYGYSDPNRDCEIVNLRIRVKGKVPKPRINKELSGGESPLAAPVGQKRVIYQGETILFNLYLRERLSPGNRFRGPAILVEYSSTLLLPPDFSCMVDGYGNLILEHFNRESQSDKSY